MEILLHQYGYLIIFAITLFEGETVLIIAGILAHQGLLNLELSMLSAFLGSTIGDQLFFQLTKHEGYEFVKKFKYVASVLPRAEKLVKKYGAYVVLFSRYIYGLRSALIVMCGLADMPSIKFSVYNIASALIWAVSYGFLGYFFSEAIGSFAGLRRVEIVVAAAIAIAALIYWIVRTANSKPASEQPK
ncbi:MAG TPA: DedA family protein [Candidatus Kryptonia bacterium]